MEIVDDLKGIVKSKEVFHLVVYDDNEDLLDRGYFESIKDAKDWANKHFPGSQYNLFKIEHFRRTTSIK
jgi:hypothetical protein